MTLPANIRVNASVPFPALVTGFGGIVVTKTNGVWSIGPAGGSLISTAVANIFSAQQTFNAGIALSGLSGSQDTTNGLTTVNTSYSYNFFNISDNINANGNTVDGVSVFLGIAGSAVSGARQAFQSTVWLTQPTNASNPARFYVGSVSVARAVTGDGGGLGTEKGAMFGGNDVAQLAGAATRMAECCGREINVGCESGSSVLDKWGLSIVPLANDVVSGSRNDAAMRFVNQAGAVGWGTIFQLGDGINANPLKTTGTILALKGAPTIANGIDLSGGTFTGSPFKSTGFQVTATGAVVGLGLQSTGFVASPVPVTLTGTSGSAGSATPSLIINPSGTFTLTLPAASAFPGVDFYIKCITTNLVNSASSNIVPLAGGAAAAAILTGGTAGKWATLRSDGTNYIIMAGVT